MYLIKSLALEIVLEERRYHLGESIDLEVRLEVKRQTKLRGIVAELICEERWSHLAFVQERSASERSSESSEFIGYMVDRVGDVKGLFGDARDVEPGQGRWAEVELETDRSETYLLGTTRFGQHLNLEAGSQVLYTQIQIPTAAPPHSSKAKVDWRLRVSADVSRGLDATASVAIQAI